MLLVVTYIAVIMEIFANMGVVLCDSDGVTHMNCGHFLMFENSFVHLLSLSRVLCDCVLRFTIISQSWTCLLQILVICQGLEEFGFMLNWKVLLAMRYWLLHPLIGILTVLKCIGWCYKWVERVLEDWAWRISTLGSWNLEVCEFDI